jgi:hypothetical protein
VLRNRKDVTALGLSVPSSNASEAVRNVIDFNVEWRRVEQIESPTGQHPLPRAR